MRILEQKVYLSIKHIKIIWLICKGEGFGSEGKGWGRVLKICKQYTQ